MPKELITICVVNYNSAEFVDNLLYTLKRLTHNSYKVIIRDNNSKKSDYDKLVKIIKDNKYTNVELYRVETDSIGSVAHGEAVNELCSKIDTTYGVIMDADAVFLIKDWDKTLIANLSSTVPIYGTQSDAPDKKPGDFPLIFAVFFIADIIKKLNVDFRSKDLSKLQDTGWELRVKCLEQGLCGGLLYDFNTRNYKKGPFRDIPCSEYYFSSKGEGKIFAAHFGRGSAPKAKMLFLIRSNGNIFFRLINKGLQYLNVLRWKRDRRKWIAICRQLVDQQSV